MKKLGFGTMRLPLLDDKDPKSIDLEQFKKMTDMFLASGFTYFDTAYPYHEECSEEAAAVFNTYYRDEEILPSQASLAVRYAASLSEVEIVLSGMSDMAQLDDNTSYMQDFRPLQDGEKDLVEKITDILNRTIRVPCTACRYCMEVCPIAVNIPEYFGLLNLYAVTGKKTNMYYQRYSMDHAKASECLKCGKCEKICPQHISIRRFLEEFAELYE